MKVTISERPYTDEDREYVKCLDILCPGCNKQIGFKLSILEYCSAIYCIFCGKKFNREEIINQK
jgi:uncharacterized CHY-type Zn-finger protein